jgi:hypothetical protein
LCFVRNVGNAPIGHIRTALGFDRSRPFVRLFAADFAPER